MKTLLSTLVLALLVAPAAALARSTLDGDQSALSFVSIKNVDVAESHRFARLSGHLDDSGEFEVSIDLDSVETDVPIRNERMRESLFETTEYPVARASGAVDPAVLAELGIGESRVVEVPFQLDLHGTVAPLTASVRVSRSGEGVLEVATTRPVLLQAGSFDLAGGIEALREIAGLSSIGKAVPVYFLLRFSAE